MVIILYYIDKDRFAAVAHATRDKFQHLIWEKYSLISCAKIFCAQKISKNKYMLCESHRM